MNKIKITYLINSMQNGGAECMLWDVVKHLDHSLFECKIVCLFNANDFPETPIVHVYSLDFVQKRIHKNPYYLKKIINYFEQNTCDILHTHLCYADYFGHIIRALNKVPLLYTTIHNTVEWPRKHITVLSLFEDTLIQYVDRIITVSEDMRRFVINERHCRDNKVVTIYNGIDFSSFRHLEYNRDLIRSKLGIDASELLIVCTAQFRREKRHDLLIDAFVKLLQIIPNAKLLLLGSNGALKNNIEEIIQKSRLTDNIIIRSATREQVPQYLGAADIFTMHSENEGFGLALIEAVAAGLPIVVPDLPCFKEIMNEGIDGLFFHFGDTNMQADKIALTWKNIQNGNCFWSQSAKRVLGQFSIEQHVSNLTTLYLKDYEYRINKKNILGGI